MKSVTVKYNGYIDYRKDFNDKDHKFKVGDYVRISKCKNIENKFKIDHNTILWLKKLKIMNIRC